MTSIQQGVVYSGRAGTERQSGTFPTICITPAGRWLCAFRAAPTKTELAGQHVLLTWSDDGGQNWSEPISPFKPPDREGRAGLFRACGLTSLDARRVLAVLCWVDHSRPKLPFFNESTEGLLDTRIYLSRSEDEGRSWSAPERVDTTPFDVPTPITGPILVLRGGELACQYELNKQYNDTTPWPHASVLQFSRDGGNTWPAHTIVTQDPSRRMFYWDQRPAVLPDGTLFDVFWTYDRESGAYLNIHGRFSQDDGRSWSQLYDTGVPGQPASPVGLPDGRIALVYVDRTVAPAIKLRLSSDDGRTWPAATEAMLFKQQTSAPSSHNDMKEAWAEMSRFAVGLPATALTPEGQLVVVYYAGPEPNLTGIHWCKINTG